MSSLSSRGSDMGNISPRKTPRGLQTISSFMKPSSGSQPASIGTPHCVSVTPSTNSQQHWCEHSYSKHSYRPNIGNRAVSASASKATSKTPGTDEKEPSPKKKKPTPACCTVPLVVLFVVACVLIALVFASVTSLSSVTFKAEVESGIKNSLGVSLENAMNVISAPLLHSASWANQMKTMIESSPHRYACDDGNITSISGNVSNAGFFYEAGMHALHRPTLQFIYLTRLSSRYFKADGKGKPVVCLISPKQAEAGLFVNGSRISINFSAGGTALENIQDLPESKSEVDITHLPLVQDPLVTNGSRWVAASVLIRLGANITLLDPSLGGIKTKFSYMTQITMPGTGGGMGWALGIDHNMASLKIALLQATPPITTSTGEDPSASTTTTTTNARQVAGAHTTLYDYRTGVLMSSTHPDAPDVDKFGKLYTARNFPVESVREAYSYAVKKCASSDCTKPLITYENDVVHTAYIFHRNDANLQLLLVQSVPRDFFFAAANRELSIILSLSVASCVLIVGGCVALLVLIQRPLSSLKENMMQAAELHNDRVEHTSTYLRDIALLSAVFDGMNQQLLIARSFVPEAVLLGKAEDSQDDIDDEGSVTGNDKSTHHTHATKITFNSHPNDPSTIAGTNNSSNNSSNGMAKLFNVAEKRVGVLSLNLVGFHALCAPERQMTRVQKIHELSTTLLTMAVGCAHGERGVMDSFHGDHFVLTFNASRAVAGPLAAAVRTANTFIGEVRESGQFGGCGGAAAGAASGRAHVGTFGIDGYRRMSVVGEAYRTANALQQAAVQLLRMNGAVREGCMIEEAALKELGTCAFHLQVVGCMQSSAHRAAGGKMAPTTAYYAHSASQDEATMDAMKADGEWLYELDAIEVGNPYVDANIAMTALLYGDVALCGELISAHRASIAKRRRSTSGSITTEVDDDDCSPAWAYVRRQHHVFTAESGAPNDVASNAKCFRLPWVVFQQ